MCLSVLKLALDEHAKIAFSCKQKCEKLAVVGAIVKTSWKSVIRTSSEESSARQFWETFVSPIVFYERAYENPSL